MKMKTTLMGAATVLVVLGMMPGAAATVQANDAITRTLTMTVVAELEMKGGGTGIYSPTSPCPVQVFGVRPNVPSVYYYQDDRETTNLKTGEQLITPGIWIWPLTCPFGGTGPGPYAVVIAPTNFYGPFSGVTVDQLLCTQGNTVTLGPVDCFPDADTALAVLSLCPKANVGFIASPADGKSALGNLAGSRAITCGPSPGVIGPGAFSRSIRYYDGGPTGPGTYCSSWFFVANNWGTDFCAVQVEDVVDLSNGRDDTGYVVTCTSVEVLVVDQNKTPNSYSMRLQSHDYLLVLDLDGTPTNWANAKAIHHSGGTLQGWHDLGGKNGFPCPPGGIPPVKKINLGASTPSLLSPK